MLHEPIAGSEDASARTPFISACLAYLPMLLLLGGAIATWFVPAAAAARIIRFGMLWAAALLCFFAGVRRGLSFRQIGGATLSQLATMTLLFILGYAALAASALPALFILLLGYAAIWRLDPVAARRREVPLYFAPLRRKQLIIPILALILLILRRLTTG